MPVPDVLKESPQLAEEDDQEEQKPGGDQPAG